MSFPNRYAVLLDGEWLKKTLQGRNKGVFPQHSDILDEIDKLRAHNDLKDVDIYRIFYYTADPLTSKATNPISGEETNFASTPQHAKNLRLINKLENEPDFAVRRGQLITQGWKIRPKALKELSTGTRYKINGDDLTPNINQKGVDMMIGLDNGYAGHQKARIHCRDCIRRFRPCAGHETRKDRRPATLPGDAWRTNTAGIEDSR